MKIILNGKNKVAVFYFFLSVLMILTASCVTEKDILYFQDIENLVESKKVQSYSTIIRPNDMLSILVSSYDLDAVRPFNLSSVAPDQLGSGMASSVQQGQTYLVDSDGNIEFPVLGKLEVAGTTRIDLVASLKEKIAAYVKDPIINVRILNYKVTVLGEVGRPGTFTIPDERISVMDAIGLAGDMTIYGRRDNVMVIREIGQGKKSHRILDLRDTKTFNSEYFYLQQNDVVVVAPNSAKVKQAGVNPSTSLYLSIASLLVGIATLVVRFN